MNMSEKTTISVGKWEVPKNLYDEYVKFRILADGYLLDTTETPSGMNMERALRWKLCVQQIMTLHRQICEAIKIPYSEQSDDEFYSAFTKKVREDVKLKG